MASKKKRLEQDPSIDPKTGKKRERRLKVDDVIVEGDKIKINFSKEKVEELRKQMEEQAQRIVDADLSGSGLFGGGIFGGGQRASGPPAGGNINVEGSDGHARPWGGHHSNHMAGGLMDFINQYAVPSHLIGEEVNFRDAVARMLHTKAVECWESLMGWQFACTFNEGQETFWFTARYYDDEAGEPLVTETLEFSEEVLAQRNWDETNLEVERQMEKMHEKCVADLAMFDD